MLNPSELFELFHKRGISFFTGVPDSLLKDFCAYVSDNTSKNEHVITANEGNAIGLAAGHYLGSGSPALVYMQNSGIGNAINPLTSLADPEVYSIPMLLMVGWRGEPGQKDEPQHVKQGRIMTQLLDALEIPWFAISAKTSNAEELISEAFSLMNKNKAPVVLLISKGTFEPYKLKSDIKTNLPLNREQAIEAIVENIEPDDLVVSTTGMASRELYEIRAKTKQGHGNDFLTVGAMGHTASIAFGLAQAQKRKHVICLDGDGSVLMHMGALAIIGNSASSNLTHIVINNGAHDSVGGQPTVGFNIDLTAIANACGYKKVLSTDSKDGLADALNDSQGSGPCFIEVRVNKGARQDLGRPKSTPVENKNALMAQLRSEYV